MGNTCNKASKIPSYDMTIPQINQIPPQRRDPIPSQIKNSAPSLSTKFRTLSQRSDLIKSRVKNFKKAEGFSQCEIALKEIFSQQIQYRTYQTNPICTSLDNQNFYSGYVRQRENRPILDKGETSQPSQNSQSFILASLKNHFGRFCQSLKYLKSLTCLERN